MASDFIFVALTSFSPSAFSSQLKELTNLFNLAGQYRDHQDLGCPQFRQV